MPKKKPAAKPAPHKTATKSRGTAAKKTRGKEFYREIGKAGGAKVKALIEAGRAALEAKGRRG